MHDCCEPYNIVSATIAINRTYTLLLPQPLPQSLPLLLSTESDKESHYPSSEGGGVVAACERVLLEASRRLEGVTDCSAVSFVKGEERSGERKSE